MPSGSATSSPFGTSSLVEVRLVNRATLGERSSHSSQLCTITFAGQVLLAIAAFSVVSVAVGAPLQWPFLAIIIGIIVGVLLMVAVDAVIIVGTMSTRGEDRAL